jgi:hypothetical protein
MEKWEWGQEQWDAIDWISYGRSRKGLARHERIKLTKITIGWAMDPRRSAKMEGEETSICGWCHQEHNERYHVFSCAAGKPGRMRLWYKMRARLESKGSSEDILDAWERTAQDGGREPDGRVNPLIFGFVTLKEAQAQCLLTEYDHWGTMAARDWMQWTLAIWAEYIEAMHEEEGAARVRLDAQVCEVHEKVMRDATWRQECSIPLGKLLAKTGATKQQWLDYWLAQLGKSRGKRQVTLMHLFGGPK